MAATSADAGSAHLCRCSIPNSSLGGVATRRLPGQAATQTLVACRHEALRPLLGADARGHLQLGPPLQLYAEPAAGTGGGGGGPVAAAAARQSHEGTLLRAPCWDPWSASVYVLEGCGAVLRLAADNTVTVVAGAEELGDADGAGGAARFTSCTGVVADGRGRLYVADCDRIRQLQLPTAWEAGDADELAAAGSAAAAGGEVVVTTLPLRAQSQIWSLAVDGGSSGGSGSLVYATATAIYRLPLGGEGVAAPVLLAGREGETGALDGRGSEVFFHCITGLVLDGEGCVYVADRHHGGATVVRRVARDGTVTTLTATRLEDSCVRPAILPNGSLALCSETHLHVLDLGLSLPPGHAGLPPPPPPQPPGPPPRTLAGDWGAMLDRQPDGSSDLTVTAGGCPFHVHKAVLRARSDYYERCLGGSFAEGACTEQQQVLNLPDVDPEVFKLALRFMYTGAVDVPPALAQGVAELADRLLLPELFAAAQAVVEANVTPSSVVGALLWAEARAASSPAFSALLGRLKGWYAEHHEEVLQQAPSSVEKLMAEAPKLLLELTGASLRAAKRARV